MYSFIRSRLLLCCPQGAFLIPLRQNYPSYSTDDEFEKYEPRPKIIINSEEESIKSFNSESPVCLDCPYLTATVQFSSQKKAVIVKNLCVRLPSFSEDEQVSIRIILNCAKLTKQQTRFSSTKTVVPMAEIFSFTAVEQDVLSTSLVRFVLYVKSEKRKAVAKAECVINGSDISLDAQPLAVSLPMNTFEQMKSEIPASLSPSMHRASNGSSFKGDSRRSSMVDSCGRFCSLPNNESSELLVSLCFESNQQCLKIVVEKGSQFGDKSKPPDTFARVILVGEYGSELQKFKSETFKTTNEPIYDYCTTVKVNRNDLDICNLRVEVWQSIGVLKRKQMLGMVQMGFNASSPDAQEHWEEMIQGQGITVSKWHVLQPNA